MENRIFLFAVILALVFSPLSSGAVGIFRSQESVLATPGETVCLNYGAYNPSENDANIRISISESLQSLFVSTDWENNEKVIPANTDSGNAVPFEICFKAPEDAYVEDKNCEGPMKEYSGNVILSQVSESSTGGSSTSAAVAGPANVKVQCVANSKSFTLLYLIIAIVLAIGIVVTLMIRKRDHIPGVSTLQ